MPATVRVAASVLFLLLCANVAAAQMFVTTGRDTLRGLPGVELLLEPTPPELRHEELTTAALRRVIERRLLDAGITLYPSQSANPSSAKPYLYVQLTAVTVTESWQAVSIQVHVRQTVRSSVTQSNVVNAMTWDAHTVAALRPGEGAQLRELILEMVGRFVDDWRAANGAPNGAPNGV